MSNLIEESLPELVIALTSRWHTPDGNLAIGIPRKKLLQVGGINEEELENILTNLRQKIADLGLELVEYNSNSENWYAIRSKYVAPSELEEDEESVLAYIISHIENDKNQKVAIETVYKKLIAGKYFSQYQLDRILKNLEILGYITKKNRHFQYSCRTLLEFNKESRQHIAEEARKQIV